MDLWTELDIDEDRDEPVLKVTVVLFTICVLTAAVRYHCCRKYRAVSTGDPSSLSPRRRTEGELHTASDFGLLGRRARAARISDEREGFSFDIFAKMARELAL